MAATGQRYCSKCGKTMATTNFYTYKDGTSCELCKPCLTMHINNFDPSTFLWLLEKFDVPYIETEWNVLRDRAYQKDPYKMNGMSVFGRYLSKMKLKQWNKYTWADTEKLKALAEEQAKQFGEPEEIKKQRLEEMREAHDNGEITDAQWQTYQAIEAPKPQINFEDPSGNPYPAGGDFEKVDLPNVSDSLTEEDKIYLALKWGRLYKAEEWVALEQLYNEFMNSFDIQGAARLDTLKMICKTSLKMNQAIDCGDVETYQKLSRVYDSMMKAAKFTEAQRKEERSGDFDAVGQIVYFAEKEKGKINRFKLDYPLDKVDEAIGDLKQYLHDLVVNDSSLAQMLENLIKRHESVIDHKEDLAQAKKDGFDSIELSDEDYEEFNKLLEEHRKEED